MPRAPARPDSGSPPRDAPAVLVGCPDARPPAYEAVAGLAIAGMLDRFATATYDTAQGLPSWGRRLPGRAAARAESYLTRRRHEGIPPGSVVPHISVDLLAAVENRAPLRSLARSLGRLRADRFDRALARLVERRRPSALLVFSDVGTRHAIPHCHNLGIPTVLSVVHGDPEEERILLASEAERLPNYFPIYLGDGRIDLDELAWLHARRADELQQADLVLVPSDHIAGRLRGRVANPERIRVVPYAADVERFKPRREPRDGDGCVFVFAGGITQRKGIADLLAAWRRAYRPGWTLRLVGGLPRRIGPLAVDLDQPGVEWLGRVGHAQMPGVLSDADVFVFPSLFEGSAVVTYEALASGLPLIVTREAGSVARDGIEALMIPAAAPNSLADALERLGLDAELRREIGRAARARAEEYDWRRYRESVVGCLRDASHLPVTTPEVTTSRSREGHRSTTADTPTIAPPCRPTCS